MPPKKTPTSSLPGSHVVYSLSLHSTTITTAVIALLVKRGFYRTRDGIRRIRSGGVSSKTSTTRTSPATRLPFEVVEIIISYLVYDRRSLRACTLTCYSWYIAAVPHLHHTLTVSGDSRSGKSRLPNAIWYMSMLGLLPLVKKLRIRGDYSWDKLSPTTPILHINQRPGTRDRLLGHPPLHAEDQTVL